MNLVLKKLFLEENTNIPSGRTESAWKAAGPAGGVTGCYREGHVSRDWVVKGHMCQVEEAGVFISILQVWNFGQNVCILEKPLNGVPH